MGEVRKELQDLRYLVWTRLRKSSGTAGSFLKSYDDSGAVKHYYKLSDYEAARGIVGHECVNEIIAQRLLSLFKIPHLSYRLLHALVCVDGVDYETYLCESDDFKRPGESKIALEDYYEMERREKEPAFDFCVRMGWEEQILSMLVIDYLILNRDRHGANLEVLIDRNHQTIRLAPLFDHGLSFVCRCLIEKELEDFDVMADLKVQAFIGGSSAADNLALVPKDYLKKLRPVTDQDFAGLFSGLDVVIGEPYLNKIREMIMRRWQFLDDLRNS